MMNLVVKRVDMPAQFRKDCDLQISIFKKKRVVCLEEPFVA